MFDSNDVEAGQAIYNPAVLKIYDLWVLGFSNLFAWKCPTKVLESDFSRLATANHLDVGVGTGYYPDKCLNGQKRRIALLDLNQNSLKSAAARVNRYEPEIYCANILEKLELDCGKFDSISLNYLLHCLPGSILEKSVVFTNLQPYLNNNGTIFGSTILGQDVRKNLLAKKLMSIYNRKGIFHNSADTLTDLEKTLNHHFKEVDIRVVGCVALFTARS